MTYIGRPEWERMSDDERKEAIAFLDVDPELRKEYERAKRGEPPSDAADLYGLARRIAEANDDGSGRAWLDSLFPEGGASREHTRLARRARRRRSA